MKILVLASQKGGTGKTTLAGHLSVAAEMAGDGPAIMLDIDQQGSLTAWWHNREADTPALAERIPISDLPAKLVELKAGGFNLAVIDTPPSATNAIRTVIALADLVLIPCRPSPHDLRAVADTVDMAAASSRPILFAVTMAKPTATLTTQAVAALSEHGPVSPTIIHDRIDFAQSMIDGRTTLELSPKSKSAAEIAALWQNIRSKLFPTPRKKKEPR
ncbi:MAG: ParA family protein [Rhodospirillaceae bacterium]